MNANDNSTSRLDVSSSYMANAGMNFGNEPGSILKNLKTFSYIYRDDVVGRKGGNSIGVVIEVAGDSDSESSVTENEDDDEDVHENGDGNDDGVGSNDVNNEENHVDVCETASNGEGEISPKILNSDQIRVFWMDGSETAECMNDVEVLDRGFLHGDYVTSVSDPTGQIGIVVDVRIDVDLATQDGSILKGKSSRDLKRIRDFIIGDYVVLGPWLGRIDDVFDNVTVQLDDGSVCKVMKADPLHLMPVGEISLEDGHFPYYPGQRVKASSSSVFKNSRWLSGMWKANRLEGTVTKVTVASLWIYWIASAGYGSAASAPDEEQTPKNLKLLSCFVPANWQLGDWCLLPSSQDCFLSKPDSHSSRFDTPEAVEPVDESDSELVSSKEPSKNSKSMESIPEAILSKKKESDDSVGISSSNTSKRDVGLLSRKKIRKAVAWKDKKARKKQENFERALHIINIKTKLDVIWQDGTTQRGLDSATLTPIENPGDHEFLAEQYVVEKASYSDETVETRRVGVVKSVNAKDKTACVRWLKPVSKAEDPKEFDMEEMVSVYELEGHPDYDYCYGDLVVRLLPISLTSNKAEHHTVENGDDDALLNHEFSDLSWVGNITGLKDGDIEVTWADGMVSTVGPQAIYVVGRDDEESMATGSNASDDAASWETVEDDTNNALDVEVNAAENAGEGRPNGEANDVVSENPGTNLALAIPMAAFGFMSRIASGLFSRSRNDSDPGQLAFESDHDVQADALHFSISLSDGSRSESLVDSGSSRTEESKITATEKGTDNDASLPSDILETTEALSISCSKPPESSHDESMLTFRCFDIIRDPSDHHYISFHSQDASRKWLRKVQKDWDILQNNLPGSIFVRVYEDRMDLLRTVIIGAYGTPYQDGLFFFDFYLPPEYPDVPPSVYYHSGGWRINPNLYEEGKVCLSLLNTWTGRGNEVWDPSTSSILQVLVSLQGLVLNSKPYFNEAGYDKHVGTAEGEKNSLSYNENTFLLNLKTMMYLMRKPPKGFEEMIIEHFRKRGPYILKACSAYMKGYLIGSLTKDVLVCESSNTNANSIGFKLMLAKLVPKLVSSLSQVGADCHGFEHLA